MPDRNAIPSRVAQIMGHAMATNRFVPGPMQRADDAGWRAVLAMANEDAQVALAALAKEGYAVANIGRMSEGEQR